MGDGIVGRCPSCGAEVGLELRECPYCGALLPVDEETLRAATEAFVHGVDQDIRRFMPAPSLVVAFLTFAAATGALIGVRHMGWGSGIGIALSLAIAFFGFGGAGMMMERAEERFFRETIVPRIEAFRKDHGMSPEEFVRIAAEVVGRSGSGLAQYLDDLLS